MLVQSRARERRLVEAISALVRAKNDRILAAHWSAHADRSPSKGPRLFPNPEREFVNSDFRDNNELETNEE